MPKAPGSVPSPNAVDNSAHENTFDTGLSDPEKHPVPRAAGFFSRAHLLGPVTKDHGDLPLLAMSLVTGLVDAASFRNWGMFIGMQTGNTVILGLSTAGLPQNPHAWLTTLVSIATFLIGAFFTFRISKLITPEGPNRNRLWEASLFLIQGLLIIISAGIAQPKDIIPQNPRGTAPNERDPASVIDNIRIVSLIPPLAFQSGMQIATSRLLGFNELPVNVLTSTYCDLMGDFKLFATSNVRRNRRAASVVLLLAGAIMSGWLLRSQGGLPAVLWLSGGIKVVTGLGVLVFMPALREGMPM
ncbi:hypothetical protein EJ03DRAFT_275716 [Teratosphaeria nubilosa]|uniref:DUF1275 domain protein n=1 Tax=Teratosphaeria nubilosa TaxID=161662 RepID=A0A6G1L529_9PEZI|nr:hypothetical protein EJ03DRAFT_275716 [Teratosphaeria nubilosa]